MQTGDSHQVGGACVLHQDFDLRRQRQPLPHPQAQHHRMPGISLQSPGQRRQVAGAQAAAGIQRGSGDDPPAQRPMLGQRIALAVEASVIELPMHRPQAQRHHPALPRTDGGWCKFPV